MVYSQILILCVSHSMSCILSDRLPDVEYIAIRIAMYKNGICWGFFYLGSELVIFEPASGFHLSCEADMCRSRRCLQIQTANCPRGLVFVFIHATRFYSIKEIKINKNIIPCYL